MERKETFLWGDSVMKGIVWDENAQKYKLSAIHAAEEAGEKLGFSLINRSKMGCTVSKGLSILEKDLEKGVRPAVALIEFGGNDCNFCWEEIANAPEEEHLPQTPLPEFETKLRQMIRLLREKGITPVLADLVPNHAERYFDFITRQGLSKENILRWLGDVQHIYRWHERYNTAVVRIGREEGCSVIGLRDAFLSQWRYEDYLCADGIHPNEKGYQLIFDILCREGVGVLSA